MKILLFAPVVGRGGMRMVIQTLMRGFANFAPRDWTFHILGQTYDESGDPVDYPACFGFTQLDPVERLPNHPHMFQFLWTHQKDFYRHLERLAPQYDAIFCLAPFWTMQVSKWAIETPFITYIPDLAWDFIDVGNILTMHFKDAIRRIQTHSAMTVFSADFHRRWAISEYGFAAEKTQIIQSSGDYVAPDGDVPPEEVARVRAKYGLPGRYFLAFHCMYHKGVVTILQAHHNAWSLNGEVPPLVIAGVNSEKLLEAHLPYTDGHIESVKGLIARADEGSVKVLGRIPDEDIMPLFAGATASISASLSEGDISGGSMSAFMARCPHIYSRIEVYEERIGIAGKGISFHPGDYSDLTHCMEWVVNNPALAEEYAERAYKWAHSRTLCDVIGEYVTMFNQVVYGSVPAI